MTKKKLQKVFMALGCQRNDVDGLAEIIRRSAQKTGYGFQSNQQVANCHAAALMLELCKQKESPLYPLFYVAMMANRTAIEYPYRYKDALSCAVHLFQDYQTRCNVSFNVIAK